MHMQNSDRTLMELSVEAIELESRRLKTNKDCDRNRLVIEQVLFSHHIIDTHLRD